MKKDKLQTLFHVCLFTAFIALLGYMCMYFLANLDVPRGTVLDADYVSKLRKTYLFVKLGYISLSIMVLSIIEAAVAHLIRKTEKRAVYLFIANFILLLFSIPVIDLCFKTVSCAVVDPVVCELTLSEKKHHTHRHSTTYDFCFSNGCTVRTSEEEYYDTDIGDKFYGVTCGDATLGLFKPNEYTLPPEQD